eukprot:COSAG05_NODE_1080_length_5950_cov_1.563323_2_plen_67_part_00
MVCVSVSAFRWLAAQALWEDTPAMAAIHLAVHMLGKLLIPAESSERNCGTNTGAQNYIGNFLPCMV